MAADMRGYQKARFTYDDRKALTAYLVARRRGWRETATLIRRAFLQARRIARTRVILEHESRQLVG